MKKVYSKLQELNSRIADCDSEIKAVQRLPFYSIFNQEAQRQKDIAKLHSLKADLIKQKLETLQELEVIINTEKQLIKTGSQPAT